MSSSNHCTIACLGVIQRKHMQCYVNVMIDVSTNWHVSARISSQYTMRSAWSSGCDGHEIKRLGVRFPRRPVMCRSLGKALNSCHLWLPLIMGTWWKGKKICVSDFQVYVPGRRCTELSPSRWHWTRVSSNTMSFRLSGLSNIYCSTCTRYGTRNGVEENKNIIETCSLQWKH